MAFPYPLHDTLMQLSSLQSSSGMVPNTSRHQYVQMSTPMKAKRKRRPKDPNKPKRAISAYFFFMNEYREKCKIAGRNFAKVGDFTKEAAARWKLMNDDDKVPYVAMSNKDRQRYEREMSTYLPKTPTGRIKHIKDPNAPKKPMTGFFLFMNEYREKHTDPTVKHKEKVSQAARIWSKEMTPQARQPYEDRHAELKVQYEIDIAKYREEQAAKALASKNGTAHTIPHNIQGEADIIVSDDDDDVEEVISDDD